MATVKAPLCPACGAPLPAGADASACPRCLLGLLAIADSEPIERDSRDPDPPAPPPDPVPFPDIPRYQVVRLVGSGGMGDVFEAEQSHPRRTVALKVIRSGLHAAQFRRRLQHEAEVLGRLQHPGIAQIYESGTVQTDAGPRPYFVMELIRGPAGAPARTLNEHANAERFTTRQRLELIARVADAVHYAHQKGVIHRDLKPANILVNESGQPKVVDFGVARVTDSDVQLTTLHTSVGQIVGTLAYMSPEQAGGNSNDVDTRSDIYALGVVCYEMLSGRLPHALDNRPIHEAVRQIREAEPCRLSSIDRTLNGDIQTIVCKAMEKEKSRRYTSAAAFAADIGRYLDRQPITARPASARYQLTRFAQRNQTLVAGVVAAMVLMAAGTVTTSWQAVQARAARQQARADLREALVAQATAERLGRHGARRYNALQAIQKARAIRPGLDLRNEAIACLALQGMRFDHEWPHPGPVAFDAGMNLYACLSPDRAIRVCERAGDRLVQTIPTDAVVVDLLLSRDARFLAAIDQSGRVLVWEVGVGRPVIPVAVPARRPPGAECQFSPDGKSIAFPTEDGAVLFMDLETGSVVRRPFGPGPLHYLRFSPKGDRFATGALRRIEICDTATGRRIAGLTHGANVTSLAWHPDGVRIAAGCQDHRIYLWNSASDSPVPILFYEGHHVEVTGVAFDRTGSRLASSCWISTRLWDAESGEELVREFGANDAHGAMWFSPDSGQLWSQPMGRRVWTISTDAAMRTLYMPAPAETTEDLCFSPDGRLLASGSRNVTVLWDAVFGSRVASIPGAGRLVSFDSGGGTFYTNDYWRDYSRWSITRASNAETIEMTGPQPRATKETADGPPRIGLARFPWVPESALVFDSKTGVPARFVREGTFTSMLDAVLSPDGRWGATCNTEWARIVDPLTGKLVRQIDEDAWRVGFSPDSKWFVTVGRSLRLREVGSWALRRTITPATRTGISFAFSHDGSVLAYPISNSAVQLIDTTTWNELATLTVPTGYWVSAMCFSRDGCRLAVGSMSGAVQLWDLHLIRKQLAEMGLDWDAPPLKPAQPLFAPADKPLRVEVRALPRE